MPNLLLQFWVVHFYDILRYLLQEELEGAFCSIFRKILSIYEKTTVVPLKQTVYGDNGCPLKAKPPQAPTAELKVLLFRNIFSIVVNFY